MIVQERSASKLSSVTFAKARLSKRYEELIELYRKKVYWMFVALATIIYTNRAALLQISVQMHGNRQVSSPHR